MKGNNGTGNIPERDLWETKQDFFNILNNQYNFTFDCCANIKNTKTVNFSSNFQLTIKENLDKQICWMNPPFSKSSYMFEHFFKNVRKGIAIYRCDNLETKVYQDIILKYADWLFIPKGRISYTPFEVGNMRKGLGTRFPSALIGIGLETPKNIEGVILIIKH